MLVSTGAGVGNGVPVGGRVGVGMGVRVGLGLAVGTGVGIGVGVGNGAGVGVGAPSLRSMVRAKTLKLSTWAVAVDAVKWTVVANVAGASKSWSPGRGASGGGSGQCKDVGEFAKEHGRRRIIAGY